MLTRTPRPLALLNGDPFLSAGWRWAQAGRIIDAGIRATPRIADAIIKVAIAYRRTLARCRDDADHHRLARRWPAVHAARLLAEGDVLRRAELEARILAGQSDADISDIMIIPAKVVACYEQLFFSVRDRLGAFVWVLLQAVGATPGGVYDRRDLPTLWKAFGFFCGAAVLDLAIAVCVPDRRLQLDPHFEVAMRLAIATLTARTAHELSLLTGLGRKLRCITGQRDDLESLEVLLCGLARMARRTATGEAKHVETSEEGKAAALASLEPEAAAEISELASAVERLESLVQAG